MACGSDDPPMELAGGAWNPSYKGPSRSDISEPCHTGEWSETVNVTSLDSVRTDL